MHTPAEENEAAIRESWRRCQAAGLDSTWIPPLRYVRPANRSCRPEGEFLETLRRAEELYRHLAGQTSAWLLADARTVLLHSLGSSSLGRAAARIGALPGADWSETGRGTNALALAQSLARPVALTGNQHYLDCLKNWSAAAAPLANGAGVLGLYVQGPELHPSARHLLAACVARSEDPVMEAVQARPPALPLDLLAMGDSRMALAVARAKRILGRDIPLLIQGETGTGKEVFARAFHRSGPRAQGPFVAVNCAAIPATLIEAELFGYVAGAFSGARREGSPGKLKQAHGGTLFLDEIGDMPLALQAVLLRVLETRRVTALGDSEEREVDVSLLCASHQALHTLVETGAFRGDLYFRLAGLRVDLPPLRQREDFARLAQDILDEESLLRPLHLTREALARLAARPWPGNLRELRNCLRLAAASAPSSGSLGWTEFEDTAFCAVEDLEPAPQSMREAEKHWAMAAVARHQGNISAAARELRITRSTLYRKLRGA